MIVGGEVSIVGVVERVVVRRGIAGNGYPILFFSPACTLGLWWKSGVLSGNPLTKIRVGPGLFWGLGESGR